MNLLPGYQPSSSSAKKASDDLTSLRIIYLGHIDCLSLSLSPLQTHVIASHILMWHLASIQVPDAQTEAIQVILDCRCAGSLPIRSPLSSLFGDS